MKELHTIWSTLLIINIFLINSTTYNYGQKLYGQLRKTVLSLTPKAMDQFKRPFAGSVRELYYVYRNI